MPPILGLYPLLKPPESSAGSCACCWQGGEGREEDVLRPLTLLRGGSGGEGAVDLDSRNHEGQSLDSHFAPAI